MREGDIIDNQKPFKRVGTHHGKFHADEVMATAILKEIFDLDVVRTRDEKVLSEMDIVYDVGGGEFDHHQVEKTYREDGTPYAACGLIWNKFGKDIILLRDPSLEDEKAYSVFKSVDASLIKGIDAIDNGLKTTAEVIIPTMNISSLISGFNPPWYSEISEDIAFNDAVSFASTILQNTLTQKFSNLKAREKVVEAYENRIMPEVMVLDKFYPWMRALKGIDIEKEVQFVIYPSREGYLLHTVRENDTFETRKDLPKSWAGKRDEELGDIVGIDDAVFCHTGRFIAGAKSFDSIMKMARIAVAEPPENRLGRIVKALKRIIGRK